MPSIFSIVRTALGYTEEDGYVHRVEMVEHNTSLIDLGDEVVQDYKEANAHNNTWGRLAGKHGTIGNPNVPVGKQQG